VFSQWPSSKFSLLPWLYALAMIMLPITYIAEGQVASYILGARGREILFKSRLILLGIYGGFNILVGLVMKFKISSNKSNNARAAKVKTSVDLDWMTNVGNISTMFGFVLCTFLNIEYLGGSQTCIFFLAPLMLLLNKDSYLLKGLGEHNRYFPIIAVTSLFLMLMAIHSLLLGKFFVFFGFHFTRSIPLELNNLELMKNLGLLGLTLPSHYFYNIFMWNFKMQSHAYILLLLAPINVAAIVFADLSSTQMLAVLGIVGSIAQYYVGNQIQRKGKAIL